MKRRDFLMAASGVAGGTAAGAAPASAQETTTSTSDTTTASGNGTTTAANGTAQGTESGGGGGGGGGPTKEVAVGPGNSLVFEPAEVTVTPGTTVHWTWESDNHNIVVESQPEGANWQGTAGGESKTYNQGHEYSHTFDTEGEYAYFCQPHKQAGMEGTVTVQQNTGGGGGAPAEEDPEHMGVPIQAHFVGIATALMIIVSLVYTFFTLKYGESPHTSGGNR